MKFSKLQATGNDFILIDGRTMEGEWSKLARATCDRHLGIGADGLILVQESNTADLKMRIFNSDGSEAEVSGNGLRCFARYAIDKAFIPDMSSRIDQGYCSLTIDTLSGVRRVKAYMSGDEVNHIEVNMGLPQFRPEQIPVEIEVDIIPVMNYPLTINGKELTLALLSMGNPHAVSFLSQPVADFHLIETGSIIERHPIFPQRTNFEVARVLSRGMIEARIWERGVGETLACGSGACAIAVAAQLLDYVEKEVDIILKGGTLTVYWDRSGDVLLTGPVEEVFTGEWLGGMNRWN
jgi:diaminopimelate epimerase